MIRKIVISVSVIVVASLLGGFFIASIPEDNASAASAKDFNPGRIIDDATFYNNKSMTASQIQSFLNARVPNCDTNGSGRAVEWGRSDITRATLASYFRNGTNGYSKDTGFHAPPYVCLRDYKQNTPQMAAASGLCSAISAKSNRTAAQIIKDVSDACGINPQVLLVLLEKEQSLVTDIWPLQRQMRNATGFACPDTAPCDPRYEGFFYQVYYAARQFNVYRTLPNNYNYIAGRTNKVYWQTTQGEFINPTGNANDASRNGQGSACGYSNLYIENQATAGLYIYTPYRPNGEAMKNLYGHGDGCSAYGNRNFWRLFTDWFGSTTAPSYTAQIVSRTNTKRTGSNAVAPGSSFVNTMRAKNLGSATWYDDSSVSSAPSGTRQIMLATQSPFQRNSYFGSDWGSCNCRPAREFTKVYEADGTTLASDQSKVLPGQIAEWDITFIAPNKEGSYRERVAPFVFKKSSLMEVVGNIFFDIEVKKPTYKLSVINRTNTKRVGDNAVPAGQKVTNSMVVKNTGTATWYDDTGIKSAPKGSENIMLATQSPFQRKSSFGAEWGSCNCRPARDFTAVYESNGTTLSANQHMVRPGQVVRWDITFTAPSKKGTYRERVAPFIFKKSSLMQVSGNIFYDIEVTDPLPEVLTYEADITSRSPNKRLGENGVASQSSFTNIMRVKNTGTATWYDEIGINSAPNGSKLVVLSTSPAERVSVFASAWGSCGCVPGRNFTRVYESNGTTLSGNQHRVRPGQIVEWDINFVAPNTAGVYRERFIPLISNDSVPLEVSGNTFFDIEVRP